MLLPQVLSSTASGDRATYRIRVPPALEHLRGHFPGFPILPGIVQLDWAVRFGRLHFRYFVAQRTYSSGKILFTR